MGPRQAVMCLGWSIKGGHKRLPPLQIQLEALPVGQRFDRAGQGAFEPEIGHAALRHRRNPLLRRVRGHGPAVLTAPGRGAGRAVHHHRVGQAGGRSGTPTCRRNRGRGGNGGCPAGLCWALATSARCRRDRRSPVRGERIVMPMAVAGSAPVRSKLVSDLELDLIGPTQRVLKALGADALGLETAVLDRLPSSWYPTGFLVPTNIDLSLRQIAHESLSTD